MKCLNCNSKCKNKFCSKECVITYYNTRRTRAFKKFEKNILKLFENNYNKNELKKYCKKHSICFTTIEKFLMKNERHNKKYNNERTIICPICKEKFESLGAHFLRKKDKHHKNYFLKQEVIAVKALKNGLSEYDIKKFIFGAKVLWKIWRKYFSEKEILKIRKRFKYKKKIFVCKKCKRKFIRRQTSTGICEKCVFGFKHECKYCKRKFKGKKKRIFCSKRCKTIYQNKLRIGTKLSFARRKRHSANLRQQYRNGRQVYGGKTKWYTINSPEGDIRIQGTFELAFCKWLNEKKLNWKKNKKRFIYFKNYTYLPDFWVKDFECYAEVKGWWHKLALLKRKKFKYRIAYIEGKQIEQINKNNFSIKKFLKLMKYKKNMDKNNDSNLEDIR